MATVTRSLIVDDLSERCLRTGVVAIGGRDWDGAEDGHVCNLLPHDLVPFNLH